MRGREFIAGLGRALVEIARTFNVSYSTKDFNRISTNGARPQMDITRFLY
jgi:hypothetical protein